MGPDVMLFDSTFFVDLDRERRRGEEGPAHAFLSSHMETEMALSVITRGELARGFDDRDSWEVFLRGFRILPLEDDVLWVAAEVFNHLRKEGTPIADNDLWIGATALSRKIPVVTENRSHLSRIPGLEVISHR